MKIGVLMPLCHWELATADGEVSPITSYCGASPLNVDVALPR